jgi:hypothetical protein
MLNHLNELNNLVSQLISVGINIDVEIKEFLLLCYLINNWEGLVIVVFTLVTTKSKLKFDDVATTLLNEDMRINN